MRDENRVHLWVKEAYPAGANIWATGAGHLVGHGESRHVAVPRAFCLHFVMRGRGVIRAGASEAAVGMGEAFCLWPGLRCEYWGYAGDPWELYWVSIEGDGALGYAAACGFGPRAFALRPRRPARLKQLLWSLIEAYQQRDEREACSALALLYAIPAACAPARSVKALTPRRREDLVGQATLVIRTLLPSHVTVAGLTRALRVSRATLFRAFREQTQASPLQYIQEFRMRRACEFLQTTNDKIASIARASGFRNEKYFFKRFRAAFKRTPSEYRREQARIPKGAGHSTGSARTDRTPGTKEATL